MNNYEAFIILATMAFIVYGLWYFIKATKDNNDRDKFA